MSRQRCTAFLLKVKLQKGFNSRFNLCLGTEYILTDYEEIFTAEDGFTFDSGFRDHLNAAFTEADIFFTNRFAMKLGLRAEYSDILAAFKTAPRASLAYKSSNKGLSLAYGDFYQNPPPEYLKFNHLLEPERTAHYILNYQYLGEGKTFRAELYYKDYDHLIKYNTDLVEFNSEFANSGKGVCQRTRYFLER
jgi:hypothetical protein